MVRGPALRGSDARIDEQKNKSLEVQATDADGTVVDHVKLHLTAEMCLIGRNMKTANKLFQPTRSLCELAAEGRR
jgi:hypothetical protein